MKKILILVSLFMLLAQSNLMAEKSSKSGNYGTKVALGVYGGFGASRWNNNGIGGLSLKFGQFPVLGFDLSGIELSVTLDGWFINKAIADSPLNWYLGIGGFLKTYWNFNSGITTGPRVPVGLQFFIPKLEKLEIFLEAAPGIAFSLNNGNINNNETVGFDISGRLGVRWNF